MKEYYLIHPSYSAFAYYVDRIRSKQLLSVMIFSFSFTLVGILLNYLSLLLNGIPLHDVIYIFTGFNVLILILLFLSPVFSYRISKGVKVCFNSKISIHRRTKVEEIPLTAIRMVYIFEKQDVMIDLKYLKSFTLRKLGKTDISSITEWSQYHNLRIIRANSFIDVIFKRK